MVIDERRMIVRLKRWLTTRRQRPRQAHRGPAAARLPALIAKAADGDKWALRELAGIVVPFVNYYCRVHLGTTETAQQVAQGISRTILKTLPSYLRSHAPFWGYVYGVTARAVADARAWRKVVLPGQWVLPGHRGRSRGDGLGVDQGRSFRRHLADQQRCRTRQLATAGCTS